MKIIRMAVLASAIVVAAGCVSESKYKNEVAQSNQYQADDAQLTALNKQLSAKLGSDDATIKQLKGELRVTVINQVLFAEGGYALNANGEKILDKIAPTLETLSKQRLAVEAFTDNVPIGEALKARFPSNVELSSARADEVVRYLAKKGVPDRIMSAQGYGERHPVASNDTPEGRAKNRRVEIVITNAPLQ
ncbi:MULTISPECIES: OmpA family protein [unclassified Dyella]|uniref:OmpA/MotB family protein n=1 Tax=unclassified Dyella TaxID=2634549 RepID=UPI000C82830D|nr:MULTISPECIES: OmpA family protein [unclassified Dyella]MDR3446937.1 OmpA family protein [Dyella sp.]PMQ04904.1 Peptidoglycan-binding protein ArfA [Dyella sp. AD56]